MKSIFPTIITLCSVLTTGAQQFTLETNLDAAVKETSGLLFLNNTLITHNDSANTNELFDIDTATGNVTRTVTVTNATNVDWEDLTHDDTYIYIGDFGNYQGERTDLKVYRITIADYFSSTTVTADIINYVYSDQLDFIPSPFATNYDAEGLIHYNNMLYIFTKNWEDGNTNIYELPKTIGSHSVASIDSLSVQGLISGATYNTINNSILLIGYDLAGAFIIQLSGFSAGIFSNGSITKTSITAPTGYSQQIEGVFPLNASEYYVSSEENSPDASGLYSINVSTLSDNIPKSETSFSFYPNPAENNITVIGNASEIQIYTILGRLVMTSSAKQIDVSHLKTGLYLIKIKQGTTQSSLTKQLIIK